MIYIHTLRVASVSKHFLGMLRVPLYWEDARLFCDLACSTARTRCAIHNYQASEQHPCGILTSR